MIMPLHGQGIDLYEFIEKGAKIDEPLASYIFRQVPDRIVSKLNRLVSYLGCRCC